MADEKMPKLNQMFYHPVDASYTICDTVAEIPEGFIPNFLDCSAPVVDKFGQPFKCTDFKVPDAMKTVPPKKAPEKKAPEKKAPEKKAAPKAKAKKAEPEGPTLKKLNLSRSEAIAILNEDNIKFNPKATDSTLAAIVSPLLEDDED